jgi:hypothetical protein
LLLAFTSAINIGFRPRCTHYRILLSRDSESWNTIARTGCKENIIYKNVTFFKFPRSYRGSNRDHPRQFDSNFVFLQIRTISTAVKTVCKNWGRIFLMRFESSCYVSSQILAVKLAVTRKITLSLTKNFWSLSPFCPFGLFVRSSVLLLVGQSIESSVACLVSRFGLNCFTVFWKVSGWLNRYKHELLARTAWVRFLTV